MAHCISAQASYSISLSRLCHLNRSGPRHQNAGTSLCTRAMAEETTTTTESSTEDDDFEKRLAQLRKKSSSGTGKKAEERKGLKEGTPAGSVLPASSASKKTDAALMLPPVPVEDPISDGLPVVLGFSPYSERLNGRMATLGLGALLAVELASGEGILKYHDGATVLLQIYTLLGLGALVIKFDKERNAIWPKA